MEFFYMQLMVAHFVTALREHEARKHHHGEYDHTHSPEAYYLTEAEWVEAATVRHSHE